MVKCESMGNMYNILFELEVFEVAADFNQFLFTQPSPTHYYIAFVDINDEIISYRDGWLINKVLLSWNDFSI